jgi:NAD+ synthase (glutamine-hydrolysing)
VIRIALAQVNPTVGDFDGNLARIIAVIKEAGKRQADLVALPELALCGYPPEDLLLKRRFLDANQRYLRELAAQTTGITVICGLAVNRGDKVYNAAAVIGSKKVHQIYHKIELPNYGVFDEKRYFQPGRTVSLLDLAGVPVGVNICEDIWVNPGVSDAQAKLGARIIVNISASPFHLRKVDERLRILKSTAGRVGAYVLYVNTVGGQDELVFDGGSMVVDPQGTVIAQAKQFSEDLLVVDLPRSRLQAQSRVEAVDSVTLAGVESEVIRSIVSLPRRTRQRIRQRRRKAATLPEIEQIYRALVLGTRDYVQKNGFSSVIVALSGGIDSALTAAVAADALGPDRVQTLFMPSQYTSQLSYDAAEKQARLLRVKMQQIAIDDLFAAYRNELEPFFAGREEDVTEENIQARIRGNLLMAFSNKFGHLVLNTANKSESAVGYTTLYGDMVGGFAVLEDIPKTLLFRICRHLNRSRKREVIAREIINRTPSAELKKDQQDTDSLPPYDVLDRILKQFVEEDKDVDEIVKAGLDRKLVQRVVRMVINAEYKRRQSAPGIKITPRAFGKDRRWPITNKF